MRELFRISLTAICLLAGAGLALAQDNTTTPPANTVPGYDNTSPTNPETPPATNVTPGYSTVPSNNPTPGYAAPQETPGYNPLPPQQPPQNPYGINALPNAQAPQGGPAYGVNVLAAPTIGRTTDYICLGGCYSAYLSSFQGATLSVLNRARPDYDAKGLPLGGFRLYPTLNLGYDHSDNVYYTSGNTKADSYFTIAPRLDLQSQWSNHALELYAGYETLRYATLTTEDQDNFDVGGSGRFDIKRGIDIFGSSSYTVQHEPRYSPDAVGVQVSPTRFSTQEDDIRFDYKPYRIGIQVGGTFQRYVYNSVPLIGGGILSNNDRDRNLYTAVGKVSYEFSPGYSAFVQTSYENTVYDLIPDRAGLNRNSNGLRSSGGLDFLIGHLVEGEVFVGYNHQIFNAPLKSVAGLDYGATLHWYATPLITVNAGASHNIVDTTLLNASAVNDRSVFLDVDYELLRNVIIQGTGTFTDDEFAGISRSDRTVNFDIGAKYLVNRYLAIRAGYSLYQRSSNAGGADYTENLFSVGVTGKL